jgi:hypothetical protein
VFSSSWLDSQYVLCSKKQFLVRMKKIQPIFMCFQKFRSFVRQFYETLKYRQHQLHNS